MPKIYLRNIYSRFYYMLEDIVKSESFQKFVELFKYFLAEFL